MEATPLYEKAIDWKRLRNVHLIAIGGTGMGALAGLFKNEGKHVTGTDENMYPPMSTFLEKLNIPVTLSYAPEALPEKIDLVIVGNACRKDHPQVLEAIRRGLVMRSFPQCIGEHFMEGRQSVVIAGTHGKTTTTTIVSWILHVAGLHPSYLCGGVPLDLTSSMNLDSGPHFVIEGDEYDSAFFDKVPKFFHYRPRYVLFTSMEFDHADIYADLPAYQAAFQKLMELIAPEGHLVAWAGHPDVVSVASLARCPRFFYGLKGEKAHGPLDWSAELIAETSAGATLRVFQRDRVVGDFQTLLMGDANYRNLLAAIANCSLLGVSADAMKKAIASFHGVKRRQEILGEVNGCTVIDDFAHHPTAVLETLKGIRRRYAGRRLWAIFEPRTQTSCRRIFQKDYVKAFESADRIIISKPFRQLPPDICFQSPELVADLQQHGKQADYGASTQEMVDLVTQERRPGDVIAIMSNGAFDHIHQKLLDALKK